MPRITPTQAGGTNVCALLDTLAVSEIGAALLARSDDGYNVLVGGQLFAGYGDHPNIYNQRFNSTAAGRYQLLYRWWADQLSPTGQVLRQGYKSRLKLADFSPLSQDLVAIQQIKERRAYSLIQAGHFDEAIAAICNIWASLPGAGYGQHENDLGALRATYVSAGGTLA